MIKFNIPLKTESIQY